MAAFLDQKVVWLSAISELELFGKRGLASQEIAAISDLLNRCYIADLNS
jgi:hypothetical protein